MHIQVVNPELTGFHPEQLNCHPEPVEGRIVEISAFISAKFNVLFERFN